MAKKFYRGKRHFFILKNMTLQNFFIFSIMNEKKLGVTLLIFHLYEAIGHFGVNFVHVCRHSNDLSVTKTNTICK
jgi:hypothetical protein